MARNRSLGSIRPRPGGGFRVRYYDEAGRQREGYSPTEAGARRLIQERAGNHTPAATERVSWGVMATEALDTLPSAPATRGVTDYTRYNYRSIIHTHVEPTRVWRMPAHKVTAVELQAVIDQVTGRGLTPRTARTVGQVINTVYRQAIRNKRATANPMAEVDLPPVGRSVIQPLTVAESQALLAHLEEEEDRWLGLYYLATGTGMRIGECLALRWGDLALEGPRPTVNVHATLVRGSRYQAHTKTPHGRRTLPLSDKVRQALLRHRRDVWGPERMAAGLGWARGAEFGDYVFTRIPRYAAHDGRPAHSSTLNRHLRATLEASGIEAARLGRLDPGADRLRWHDLRHGFATHALDAGVPMREVSRWLGHASEAITSDIYYAWTEAASDRMVTTLEAIGY